MHTVSLKEKHERRATLHTAANTQFTRMGVT